MNACRRERGFSQVNDKVTFTARLCDSSTFIAEANPPQELLHVVAACSLHHAATSGGQHLIACRMPVFTWAAGTT